MGGRSLFPVLAAVVSALVIVCHGQRGYNCGSRTRFLGTNGTINSYNYPYNYNDNTNCTYFISATSISQMSLTVVDLDTEQCCDWLEVSCTSHRGSLPVRYYGSASYLRPVVFDPCAQIQLRFYTDASVTRRGFFIEYQIHPIECSGNCTPTSTGNGYVCPCDTNQTNVTTPTTVAPQCSSPCTVYRSPNTYAYCRCILSRPSTTSTTRRSDCAAGCWRSYDFYGNPTCTCSTTTATTCAPGCYQTTDSLGYPYCSCPRSTPTPISCPYGCYPDSDYWGNQYCRCSASTEPPIWCAPGCSSDVDVYGERYCNCPTTTPVPCNYPCYYQWDYTYDVSGRSYCYCPTTTPPPQATGCNQTLTTPSGFVTSSNYPRAYPTSTDCYQYITVPTATSIRIRPVEVNLYYDSMCAYEYIEVTGCDGSFARFCSTYTFPTSGLDFKCTQSQTVTILFHSYSYNYGYRGFKLAYSANFGSNCSDSGFYLSQGSTGFVTSPNFPGDFPFFSECYNYLFTDEDDIKIKITFEQLKLEETDTCENVFLKLACQDEDDRTMQTVCGKRLPTAPFVFDCRVLQIYFRSNVTSSLSPRGFKLRYSTVRKVPAGLSTIPGNDVRTGPGRDGGEGAGLSESSRLGIGLGVGIGGFFLIILIVIIILLIVIGQRQAAERDQLRLQDLAVVCRNMNGRDGADASSSAKICAGSDAGFTNPLAMVGMNDDRYSTAIRNDRAGGEADGQSTGGGFVAENPKKKLVPC